MFKYDFRFLLTGRVGVQKVHKYAEVILEQPQIEVMFEAVATVVNVVTVLTIVTVVTVVTEVTLVTILTVVTVVTVVAV